MHQLSSTNYRGVSALLDHLVASKLLPGANVLILRNGHEELYYESGLKDVATGDVLSRDTIFRIFSMTKPITAAAAMILVDDGKIRLDDPVSNYIPELSHLRVFSEASGEDLDPQAGRTMTVKDLLTHTAGFTYWFQPTFSYWRESHTPVAALYDTELGAGRFERWRFDPTMGGLDGLAKSLAKVPLVDQPGTRWHYSMSLEVAGIVIERASGFSLDVFTKERIFDPLGMRDTGFSVAPEKADRLASLYGSAPDGGIELLESGRESLLLRTVPGLSGGGGLASTIDDYARFAQMLLNRGELKGHRVLSHGSVREMMTNQLRPEQLEELPELATFGLGGNGHGLGFGLGGAVVVDSTKSDTPSFKGEYSWGGAASTTFWVDPENQLAVVFMTQLLPPSRELLRDKLHSAVYGALLGS